MDDVDVMIRRDIEDDPGLTVKALMVEITRKGLFPRRRILRVAGIVKSEHEREKVETIVRHHAGDMYLLANEIVVSQEKPTATRTPS